MKTQLVGVVQCCEKCHGYEEYCSYCPCHIVKCCECEHPRHIGNWCDFCLRIVKKQKCCEFCQEYAEGTKDRIGCGNTLCTCHKVSEVRCNCSAEMNGDNIHHISCPVASVSQSEGWLKEFDEKFPHAGFLHGGFIPAHDEIKSFISSEIIKADTKSYRRGYEKAADEATIHYEKARSEEKARIVEIVEEIDRENRTRTDEYGLGFDKALADLKKRITKKV